MEELRRGQVRVCLRVALCHRGHLLLPVDCFPAPGLLSVKDAPPHHHRVLPAAHHHRGFHLADHVGAHRPAADATEQV